MAQRMIESQRAAGRDVPQSTIDYLMSQIEGAGSFEAMWPGFNEVEWATPIVEDLIKEMTARIQAPTTAESLIPVYGSGKQALHEFETGHWVKGLLHSALAASDVFLIKTLLTGGGKLLTKGLGGGAAKTGGKTAGVTAEQLAAREAAATTVVKEGKVAASTKKPITLADAATAAPTKERSIKLGENLPPEFGTVPGHFSPRTGRITLDRAAIRDVAEATGNTIREELYRTAYHESFHKFIDPIDKFFARLYKKDTMYDYPLWRNVEEFLAEGTGIVRSFLRQQLGIR